MEPTVDPHAPYRRPEVVLERPSEAPEAPTRAAQDAMVHEVPLPSPVAQKSPQRTAAPQHATKRNNTMSQSTLSEPTEHHPTPTHPEPTRKNTDNSATLDKTSDTVTKQQKLDKRNDILAAAIGGFLAVFFLVGSYTSYFSKGNLAIGLLWCCAGLANGFTSFLRVKSIHGQSAQDATTEK